MQFYGNREILTHLHLYTFLHTKDMKVIMLGVFRSIVNCLATVASISLSMSVFVIEHSTEVEANFHLMYLLFVSSVELLFLYCWMLTAWMVRYLQARPQGKLY